MKKTYEAPVTEIVTFEAADVITTSGAGDKVIGTNRPATDLIR